MLELIALVLGTVTTSLIALAVLLKNPKSITNQLLLSVSIGLVGWSITTYFSLHAENDLVTLFWIRAIMFFVVVQNASFFLLAIAFPAKRLEGRHRRLFLAVATLSVLAAATAVSPFLFTDFHQSPVPGPGMALFLPHALICAGGGVLVLIYRTIKAHGIVKVQLRYLLAGTSALFTLVPVGNFVLPVVFQWNHLVVLSPLYSVVFAGLVAYAIVRHRLFDIRRAIIRTLSYVLALVAVLCLYGFGVLFGVTQFFGFGSLPLDRQYLLFGLAAVVGLGVSPLMRFFDEITQRIFFRRTYNTQQAIDDMTGIFVRSDTLQELLEDSSRNLMRILGASSVTVSLTHKQAAGQRVAYTTLPAQAEHPLPIVTQSHMLATNIQLVAFDMLDDDAEIGSELDGMNISVVSQLRSPAGVVGYLMLGYKQNGTHYRRQDLDFIDIVSDEFAIAIQSMLRFQEISEFNVQLKRRVEDATAELRVTNQKLQELDKAKDEFISMASHQLRTPLTSVKGFVSMVLDGDVGTITKEQRQVLQQAYESSQRMVFLIGDFLNVSRLQTGKFVLEMSDIDLAELAQEEIEQLSDTAKSRQVSIEYKKPTTRIVVSGDENKLRQVMMNFMDNAIFYSVGGKVTVQLHKDSSGVVFKVIDTGIGVPKDEQPKLFTKFFRATNARQQRPDGTGIGLYMAKKVIVAHGGTILFDSKEGKGSTFGFKLPLKDQLKQLDEQPDTTGSNRGGDSAKTK